MEEMEVTIKLPAELAIRIQKIANASNKTAGELCSNALHFFFSPNSEGWENFGQKCSVNREISEEYAARRTPLF
jgi:hypothetical protein